MRSPVFVTETITATGFDVRIVVPEGRDVSDRPAFERERLISLIIDVGMMRRDVAIDVADAILARWTLQNAAERAAWEQAYQTDTRNLREKLANVHRLMCEANARLDDADVEAAWDKIRLAIRLAA